VGGIAGFCPKAKMRRRKKHSKSSASAKKFKKFIVP
jgi:hypothetical protein